MAKESKDKFVKVRVTSTLKGKFIEKLERDGICQSDFFNACIINYLDIKTIGEVSELFKIKRPNKESI